VGEHQEEKHQLCACPLAGNLLAIVSNGGTVAQPQNLEQKIWTLLDDAT
jgi:hypothetical protein